MLSKGSQMDGFKAQFPNLFEDYIPPNGALRMRFELGDDFPAHLTGTVKMVANVGDKYIALRSPDGWWEPGGKPELGESYQETIRREMLEETGAIVKNFTLFGAFHCISLRDAPPEPGLLWPEFYFLWGYGEVEFVSQPRPTSGEQILEIAVKPLDELCALLVQTPGAGPLLVDIYRLADSLR
jgi:8-oxo-dGTP pyrophosphatase MutT (NUDIX family)